MSYLDLEFIRYDGLLGLGSRQLTIGLIMTFTFAVYGGLHLLAWQYSFSSKAERYLWQTSTVITMSTGLIFPTHALYSKIILASMWRSQSLSTSILESLGSIFRLLLALLFLLIIASRAFLVIESFIALPNSPPSTYIIPTWSAYVPHI